MAMYEPQELHKRWERGDLSVNQAIGQLILRVIDFVKRFATMETRQLNFEQRLRALEKRQP